MFGHDGRLVFDALGEALVGDGVEEGADDSVEGLFFQLPGDALLW